jgi:hypothetical protein
MIGLPFLRAWKTKLYSDVNAVTEDGQETVGKGEAKMCGVAEGNLSHNSWEFVKYSFRSRPPRFQVRRQSLS